MSARWLESAPKAPIKRAEHLGLSSQSALLGMWCSAPPVSLAIFTHAPRSHLYHPLLAPSTPVLHLLLFVTSLHAPVRSIGSDRGRSRPSVSEERPGLGSSPCSCARDGIESQSTPGVYQTWNPWRELGRRVVCRGSVYCSVPSQKICGGREEAPLCRALFKARCIKRARGILLKAVIRRFFWRPSGCAGRRFFPRRSGLIWSFVTSFRHLLTRTKQVIFSASIFIFYDAYLHLSLFNWGTAHSGKTKCLSVRFAVLRSKYYQTNTKPWF